jgi:hypothetical protein
MSPIARSSNLLRAAAFASLILSAEAFAQPIDTNRPGFSFTPGVVERGQIQLETGLQHDRPDNDSRSTHLPLAELRFGVADQIEVFVSSLSWTETEAGANTSSGLVDPAIGTKFSIGNSSSKTRMALLFQLSVPIGDESFSSDRWDPGAAFVWTHDSRIPLAGTVKISKFREGFQLDNGLKLPFSFADRHSGFIEWEANIPEHGDDTHWLNGGYQWLMDERMQLDLIVGLGLTDETGDYRLGIGFSYRFD